MRRWEGWLAFVGLMGCAGYGAGDLHTGDPLAERGTECVDLRVTPYRDAEVDQRGWLAVRYEVGNHCRRAVTVDLGQARVARLDDGLWLTPRGQRSVRPVLLDGGTHGSEILAYAGAGDADVCVDITGVMPGAEQLAPICFSAPQAAEEGKP